MTRVLSALLLLPLVLAVVWFLPPIGTLALAAVASVLAFMELARMAEALGAHVPRALAATSVAAACLTVGLGVIPLEVVLLAALVLIGVSVVATEAPGPAALPTMAASLFAVVYIGVPLGAVAAIHVLGGREAVVLLMITIVVSDSAQYYTGRAFGRSALAPAISPKKTREGAIGGGVFGTAAMVIGARLVFPSAHPAAVVVAAIAVVASGIVGDLFESLLKRSAGVKDSSALIPGHGGILDRIDSWLFAGPVFYIFVRYLQA
jgi:phosphatidate cytidylyltransferase